MRGAGAGASSPGVRHCAGPGGGRLLWRRKAAAGMLAEVGVDSGRAAPAGGGRSRSLTTWRLELIRIAPKSALESNYGRGRGRAARREPGALEPGTRRTCQALPRFPLGSLTTGVIWRPGGGWIRVPCAAQATSGLGLERAWAGLDRPSLQLDSSWSLPLSIGRNLAA